MGFTRANGHIEVVLGIMRLFCVLMLAGAFAGCGRKGPQSTELPQPLAPFPAEAATAPAAPAPESEESPSAGAGEETDTNNDLESLNLLVSDYITVHQKIPKDFSELVAAGCLRLMPPAPAGKRFSIDPGTGQVTLASR